jgi:hypothetical protein
MTREWLNANVNDIARQLIADAREQMPVTNPADLDGVRIEVRPEVTIAHVDNPWSPDPLDWPERMRNDAARWQPDPSRWLQRDTW